MLCLVAWDPVEGLDPGTLAVSFLLEREKSGLTMDWEVRNHPDECPGRGPAAPRDLGDRGSPGPVGPSGVLVVAGTLVVFEVARGPVVRFDVADLDPLDRGQDVARRVLAFFRRTWAGGDLSLVEPGFSPSLRPAPAPPVRRVAISVSGVYEFQPGPGLHVGGPGLATGLLLADERLVLGLRVAWLVPRVARGSEPSARVQALPVSLRFHGGPATGRFLVRFVGGGGFEWRRVEFGPPAPEGTRVQSGFAPVLDGGFEAVFRWTRSFRLTVGVEARAFLGGRGYAYQGTTLYEAPRYGVGLVFEVGWVFPLGG